MKWSRLADDIQNPNHLTTFFDQTGSKFSCFLLINRTAFWIENERYLIPVLERQVAEWSGVGKLQVGEMPIYYLTKTII